MISLRRLTPTEFLLASLVAQGLGPKHIALHRGANLQNVKNQLRRLYAKLDLTPHPRPGVKLAVYWNTELFQIGLRELGLIPAEDASAIAA